MFTWKTKSNCKPNSVNYEELFKDSCWDNCEPFSPHVKIGKVIKVYDGDSITIAAKPYENYPIYRFSVRLNGIDTPELRTSNENEKAHAKIARDALHDKIYDKIVELKNVESEKYGRLLADIYLGDENINEWLINQNFAVKYDGGTKEKPASWMENVIY
uniref:TNase-like domain-containing protein n=1 Tax=viral metagenome TaxID=1070528 RepID=A0A6C0FAZ2_9ZZZZ|tara:strand:+ start:12367 stop:12843 length:477 start_codon:yes stop_codon:yes gene_type:complete